MDREQYFDRYGLSTWLFQGLDLRDALIRMAAGGFRTVELWAWGAHLDPRLKPNLGEADRLLQDLGLKVHTLHAPSDRELRIGDPDPSLRRGWMEAIVPCLDYAAQLGATGVVVHSSTLREPLSPQDFEEGCLAVGEFVSRLRERASGLGVRILLENLTNFGYPRFGTSLLELTRVFPEPDTGFCLDVGHALLNRMPIDREVAAAGSRLLSVHASNNYGEVDDHKPLDEGVLSWNEVVESLDRIGYQHPIILEVAGGEDPERVLGQLETLWQRV